MSEDAVGYDATHIEVLEGLEAVRKRPGMYVGSTGEHGLHELVFLLVGRALQGAPAGRGRTVDVALLPEGRVRVADDGPGVQVEAAGGGPGAGLESQMTLLYAGGTRPLDRHSVIASRFALGPAVANALSARLRAEVWREGFHWVQEYARGAPVGPPVPYGPTTRTGTTITFRPDPGVFGTARCSFDALAECFRELAFVNRGVQLSLTDRRGTGTTRSVRCRFPDGLRDFAAFLTGRTAAAAEPDITGFEKEDPRMAGTMEVAMTWTSTPGGHIRSFANSSSTPQGGTHVAGLLDGLAAAVNAFARERRLLAPEEPDLGPDRIGAHLTAVVSVRLDRPEFKGATRGLLGGTLVRDCVREAVQDHMAAWLRENPNPPAALLTGADPFPGSGGPVT
ncbi:DNA gyrase subunit B [Streptomyces sp. NPDC086777]|uniref:DNA gyrase subunit B n=1 Tax=Streptomyces sp. NPDC086777 TaxID=3154866 RepID=UPI00344FC3F8